MGKAKAFCLNAVKSRRNERGGGGGGGEGRQIGNGLGLGRYLEPIQHVACMYMYSFH